MYIVILTAFMELGRCQWTNGVTLNKVERARKENGARANCVARKFF